MNYLRSTQKILALCVAGLFVCLGYRLFLMGVTGEFDFSGGIQGIQGKLISGSPGLFFAFLGATIVLSVIWKKEDIKRTRNYEKSNDGKVKLRETEHHGGCFISTAVCEGLGKSDDCFELNTLRSFRDECLLFSAPGRALVKDYYRMAPEIAAAIVKSPDYKEISVEINRTFLGPCLSAIRSGESEEAVAIYLRMLRVMNKVVSDGESLRIRLFDIKKEISKVLKSD